MTCSPATSSPPSPRRPWPGSRCAQEHNVGTVVIVSDRLVGLVSLDDLLRWLARELSNLAEGIGPEVQVK